MKLYKEKIADRININCALGITKFLILFLLFSYGCSGLDDSSEDLSGYVDPFIGTDSDGHTFPGPVFPFGMVQPGPDTRITGNDCATGYHYSDSVIMGFSHIRYSGTGRGAGGDFMFMPTIGEVQLSAGEGSDTNSGYRSSFSHKNETASPGYYKVLLDDYNIIAELTVSKRVGFHKYTFPKDGIANVVLDLTHGIKDRPDSLYLKITGKNRIVGMRKSIGGLRDFQTLYFAAEFSEDFNEHGISVTGRVKDNLMEASAKDLKAFFRFKGKKMVMLKVSVSKVDMEGAEKNLEEIKGWEFDRVKKDARKTWNKELGKLVIKSKDASKYTIFYTALYHSCIMPSLNTDIDGRYRSTNNKVYTAKDFTDYTNFSLWDTFRALHPLMTIINQSKTRDFIRTFIERYEHSGSMPIFELSGNDLLVMIGYHSLPVIADAYVKGIRGYDVQKVIEGMKGLAEMPFEERNEYKTFGYIPYDYTDQAVSRSLEFAFDDWSLAQVAKGRDEKAYSLYSNRANFFKNLYDKETGFMRPKDAKGKWMADFDPLEYTRKYTQGNAWQYSTFVLQDIHGLIEMMGGDKEFEAWLDQFFRIKNRKTYQGKASAMMIGQYYHGNEPGHHVAYLYNYAGVAWKTQRMVRKIMETQYDVTPDGLAGNDDAGQMSAWYVLSAMGFYSVTPGVDYYVIGSPLFDELLMNLENGKKFKITVRNNRDKNIYIQSVTLNGKPYTKSYLKHNDIMNGGTMEFVLGDKPNTLWASSGDDRPCSLTFKVAAMPRIIVKDRQINRDGVVTFNDKSDVSVNCDMTDVEIFYTTDGSEPGRKSNAYRETISIDKSCILKVKSFKDGYHPGYTSSVRFRKLARAPAKEVNNAKRGIGYDYREVWVCKSTAQIDQYPVLKSGITTKISSDIGFKMAQNHGLVFKGYLKIPETGIYTFYADTEYAAALWIDDELIASNESTDWLGERSGTIGLQKGFHTILLKDFQMGGETELRLLWKGPGISKREIPEEVLFH